jgi:peptidoglycan hydrolase CwlO-like protein
MINPELALDMIPLNIVNIIVTFAASYAVIQFKVKENREEIREGKEEMKNLYSKLETMKNDIDNKMDEEQTKREKLRDELVERVHHIDKKVTEIHTILTTKK